MEKAFILSIIFTLFFSCGKEKNENSIISDNGILGFELLEDISGLWSGLNNTSFGTFDNFIFDFRPISASHVHSIYESGFNSNIINSFFVAEHNGELQVMSRNGGWLGNQYRATYFVMDIAEDRTEGKYYRLVDAVGGQKRAYVELIFNGSNFQFKAYKDNSGSLDEPILHMDYNGNKISESVDDEATALFNFPQEVSEVNLNGAFDNLIDPDSALFLTEESDPFPKADHGHLSELKVNINNSELLDAENIWLFVTLDKYIESNPAGLNFPMTQNIIRPIRLNNGESEYVLTYLHPGKYYLTAFEDKNDNFYPDDDESHNYSQLVTIEPETEAVYDLYIM